MASPHSVSSIRWIGPNERSPGQLPRSARRPWRRFPSRSVLRWPWSSSPASPLASWPWSSASACCRGTMHSPPRSPACTWLATSSPHSVGSAPSTTQPGAPSAQRTPLLTSPVTEKETRHPSTRTQRLRSVTSWSPSPQAMTSPRSRERCAPGCPWRSPDPQVSANPPRSRPSSGSTQPVLVLSACRGRQPEPSPQPPSSPSSSPPPWPRTSASSAPRQPIRTWPMPPQPWG